MGNLRLTEGIFGLVESHCRLLTLRSSLLHKRHCEPRRNECDTCANI